MSTPEPKRPRGRDPFENLMSVSEVAAAKGVNVRWVIKAIHDKKLPAWRTGRFYFVTRLDAEAWHVREKADEPITI
jgi:excisionase family DNA binding protein